MPVCQLRLARESIAGETPANPTPYVDTRSRDLKNRAFKKSQEVPEAKASTRGGLQSSARSTAIWAPFDAIAHCYL